MSPRVHLVPLGDTMSAAACGGRNVPDGAEKRVMGSALLRQDSAGNASPADRWPFVGLGGTGMAELGCRQVSPSGHGYSGATQGNPRLCVSSLAGGVGFSIRAS